MTAVYRQSLLDQGLRLVTETIPGAASASLGFWAAAGSRDEAPGQGGLAHLIEHMVFKGTVQRDKKAIAREIDRQGGLANAFTTQEHTCFHTRVRPEHLAAAVDLLADFWQNACYDPAELELEKQVIREEIAMVEDEPEELIHDLAAAAFWPGHPLGRPVAGGQESVAGLARENIVNWLADHYVGPRLLVSAAGVLDHDQLADLLAAKLRVRPETVPRRLTKPEDRPRLSLKTRRLEQAHLVLTTSFPDLHDSRRHAAAVLNLALGGNMSSRLFQEIREERGLAYSVYSSYAAYQGAGCLEIYAGAAPDKIARTLNLARAELERLRTEPLSRAELDEAVSSLTTNLILGSESLDGRMSSLAKNELIFGRPVDLAETCRELAAVTADDIQALAAEFWPRERQAVFILGPVKKSMIEV